MHRLIPSTDVSFTTVKPSINLVQKTTIEVPTTGEAIHNVFYHKVVCGQQSLTNKNLLYLSHPYSL